MTRRILVVDDSRMDRCLIMGLLGNRPEWHVDLAENGRQAAERVAEEPPELIVTDLLMPEMSGLDLLAYVKHEHLGIPVVLLTAYGNESIARDALQAGAASYVAKSRQAERLPETVQRILQLAAANQYSGRLPQCLKEYRCQLALDNDAALVHSLVEQIQAILAGVEFADLSERVRVGEALEEALLNAMYHGNLEITQQELSQARGELDGRRLSALVEQRRQLSRFRDRKIQVDVSISPGEARFVVCDEGSGFDVESIVAAAAADVFETGEHRGLTLIQCLMDEVSFHRDGSELKMSKRLKPAAHQPAERATS